MSIESEIKKEGIEVINTLDSLTINSIASIIVEVLQNTFPEKNLNTHQIYSDIVKLNMYIAKLPAGCSAKYFYKNKSIYFSPDTSFEQLSDLIVHECIHYLQEKRDKKGKISRLGFCDFKKINLPGMGINEAAVQLLASKCTNQNTESVTYFDLTFNTSSPDYYPLECALVNQLSYLVGNNVLFDSTLNSNDKFKEIFISYTSKQTYETILKNIDLLIEMQETIAKLSTYNINYPDKIKKVEKNNIKIESLKVQIKELFINTQNFIMESYFDNAINLLYTKESYEKYRTKLYNFRNYIATTEGYTAFNKYYINKMVDLDNKIENGLTPSENGLILYKQSLIKTAARKLSILLKLSPKTDYVSYLEQEFYD